MAGASCLGVSLNFGFLVVGDLRSSSPPLFAAKPKR